MEGPVHLSGVIPVTVVVEDGTVSRVIAHDDLFRYDVNDEGFQVLGPDTQLAPDEDVEEALRIAENESWPAWEWGW